MNSPHSYRCSHRGNDHSRNRNPLRAMWDARARDTLTPTLFQIESALAIQLANAMQPDRERSYRALESLRSILTKGRGV